MRGGEHTMHITLLEVRPGTPQSRPDMMVVFLGG